MDDPKVTECDNIFILHKTIHVRILYPNGAYYGWSSYNPMIQSFGQVLLQVDDADYQGDTRVLLKNENKYGILIFGWGSCSGCDALQACSNYEELADLYVGMWNRIRWNTPENVLKYLKEHDWEADFAWWQDETKEFVKESIKILEQVSS